MIETQTPQAEPTGSAELKSSRPYWQTAPCPPWCLGHHREHEHGSDRDHIGRWDAHVTLTLMEGHTEFIDGGIAFDAPELLVWLGQGYRETEPRVLVDVESGPRASLELTPGEALALAKALVTAVDIAEGNANPTEDGEAR